MRRRVAPSYARIYAVVRRIPRGRIATYGQVARLAGLAGHARQVGYALHALPEDNTVPWHRVINARGEISRRANPSADSLQRQLLAREGVALDARERIDLRSYQWHPRASPPRERRARSEAKPSEGRPLPGTPR